MSRRTTLLILAGALTVGITLTLLSEPKTEDPLVSVATTTAQPSTTTSTTTTTAPPPALTFFETPEDLALIVEGLYRWLDDPESQIPSEITPGLVEALQRQPLGRAFTSSDVTTTVGQFGEAATAVTTVGEDVILSVADPDWRIVGANLPSADFGPWFGPSPRFMLVIGSDARPGQDPSAFRADSLHVIALVPETGDGAVVGIPRDSWIDAPYGGRNKVTNMMASRGPEVVTEALSNRTGLPFEGHVMTGFAGFVGLVDAFGGVDVEVPFAMNEPKSKAYFRAGLQLLGGSDALAFSRNRTLRGGDFTRQLHGGLVIVSALVKAQSGTIADLPALLEILDDFAFTDMDAEAMLTFGAAAFATNIGALPNVVVPGSVGMAGEASVVFLGEGADKVFADLADGTLSP